MAEEYDLKPYTLRADKTKPARIVQLPDGRIELWFYDTEGNLRKLPLTLLVLPSEIAALKDQLNLTDLLTTLKTNITTAEVMVPVDIQSSYIMVPVDIQGQVSPLDVDTLASELPASGEIDTSTESSPFTALTPSSGKAIDTRGVYLFTDSNGGEVWAEFVNSGKLLAKIYASKFARVDLPAVRFTGDVDESIVIKWSGLDTGAKITYIIRYKEV